MTENTENRQNAPKRKNKGMPLLIRILILLVVVVLVVLLSLQIAVWVTEFNSMGELLSYIRANISNLPK